MFFFSGTEITYVIHGLESTDKASYILGFACTLLFGILVEGIIFSRTYLTKLFQTRALTQGKGVKITVDGLERL